MAQLKRNQAMWLIRTIGALMIMFTAFAGATGQAFANDDNNDEVVTYGPNACTVVVDLPVYSGATCIKHKSELNDEGVTETKNSYVVQVAADVVRQSFEASFQKNGWTVMAGELEPEDGK